MIGKRLRYCLLKLSITGKNQMKSIPLHDYNIVFDNSFQALHDFLNTTNYSKKIVLVDENTRVALFAYSTESIFQ
jgi:hypothetical protein